MKNASDEADQMEVAKLLKPMGARMSVAGSSFMVRRNVKAPPAKSPGINNGRSML